MAWVYVSLYVPSREMIHRLPYIIQIAMRSTFRNYSAQSDRDILDPNQTMTPPVWLALVHGLIFRVWVYLN